MRLDNINRDNEIEIWGSTGDRYVSEPPREQLQIGPLRKQLLTRTIRIERHQ